MFLTTNRRRQSIKIDIEDQSILSSSIAGFKLHVARKDAQSVSVLVILSMIQCKR